MKLYIKTILFSGMIALAGLSSCKKDNVSTETSLPAIPVTVENTTGNFLSPIVNTSLTNRTITIILTIPSSSGRTIKEITRVAANTVYSSVQTTTGLYKTGAIAGNGTNSITFTTTLDEYISKGYTIPTAAQAGGAAAAFLTRYFFFMLTLDDGQIIIPTYVRVYVNP
ncbi:hypothetical protein [Pedobacter sp. MC2016-24]|uniref:hypothetical protein n=1 Tax=Pedobacter sp. MC2016-24 TaxID=2780090 RepID=UPI001882F39D|nr:hypothetical protein [Pedobacter sp. MC2016-24]MBE9602956.1 hypothetical protein [Pedobacter sp. MC2016-24]